MWPIQFAFRLRSSCRIFLYSLTLSSASSFLTRSVQLIFSILLQHHILKLSRCFWSTARSVQVKIFGKKVIAQKMCFEFFYNFCLIFFLRRIQRHTITIMYIGLRVRYLLLLSDCNETWIFWTDCRKYSSITFNSNLSSTAELFCGDGWTDGHDEANSRFSQFCNPLK